MKLSWSLRRVCSCTAYYFAFILGHAYLQNFDIQEAKLDFEQDFQARCTKYLFVKQFYRNLEFHSTGRYIVFVYDDKATKHGGVGDRLAGLISAVGISLQINRTLLIYAENQLGRLF